MLGRLIVNAVALLVTAHFINGIELKGVMAALIAALVLGVVNAVIRPLLVLLSLPIQVLTLGLFTFVINALMLWLVSAVVVGFHVAGFAAALVGSLVLAIVSSILSLLVGVEK